jgi:hypothetical protein
MRGWLGIFQPWERLVWWQFKYKEGPSLPFCQAFSSFKFGDFLFLFSWIYIHLKWFSVRGRSPLLTVVLENNENCMMTCIFQIAI